MIQPEHQFGLFPQIFAVTDMAFDLSGNLVIAGTTFSTGFPTTADAADRTCGDDGDAFVVVVSTGGDLRYATCLGGPSLDREPSVAVSPDGSLWVLMNTCFYESDGINGCSWNGCQATLWRIRPGVSGDQEQLQAAQQLPKPLLAAQRLEVGLGLDGRRVADALRDGVPEGLDRRGLVACSRRARCTSGDAASCRAFCS